MTTRKRVRSTNPNVSGGGGGGGSNPTIVWEPGDTALLATVRPTLLATTELYTVTAQAVSKDAYVDNVVGCPVDVNHNGADIIVDGIVATRRDGLIGFDLSAFPNPVTMTSATLKIVVKLPPAVTNQAMAVTHITAGTETWTEAGVKCSNKPTDAAEVSGAFTVNTTDIATTVKTITLPTAQKNYVGTRMGTTSCSFYILNNAGVPEAVTFYDKEDVAAHPPTLDMVFTRP